MNYTGVRCCYITDGIWKRCGLPAVGIYPRKSRDFDQDWPLCDEHAKQKHHPRGVHMDRFERFKDSA